MAFITRLSRLVQADAHAVLDRIEEPDIVLRHAVREMEQEYHAQQRRVDQIKADLDATCSRSTQLDLALQEIGPQLDDCFSAGRDDLARDLVQRRLELQQVRQRTQNRKKTLQSQLDNLTTLQAENKIHLQSMRQKLDILVDEPERFNEPSADSDSTGVTQTDIEVAFIQEKQRRSES